jgi:hypothetical protein
LAPPLAAQTVKRIPLDHIASDQPERVCRGCRSRFIASFDEAIIGYFISGGGTATLPRKMFGSPRDQIGSVIAVTGPPAGKG